MSAYVSVNVEFKDKACLIEALKGLGLTEDQIEVHEEPQSLFGYHGDERPEKANIIVRRKHIGASSNDFGFVRQGDGYKMLLSEYDHAATPRKFKCGGLSGFTAKLKVGYAEAWSLQQAKTYGYTPTVTKTAEKTVIRLTRW